jgi:hypothetical protein
MLRRLSAAALILFFGLSLATSSGQEKKDAPKKDEVKKDDKKKDDKKDDKTTSPDKLVLKWDFGPKNKEFYQTLTTTTNQTMNVMNNEVKQTQKQVFYFKWAVEKEEKDVVTIKQSIIGVKMDIDIGNQKINYDSTNQKDAGGNPLGEFFKQLVGSEFTITFDVKQNKVTGVKGREEFLAKLSKANPQMKPLLEAILSDEALKQMAEPTFAAVPNGEVEKGKPWTRTSTLNMGPIGSYTNDYKYTYESKDDKGLAKIKVETTLKYKEPGDVAGVGGLPFKIKSADLKTTNAKGDIWFDVDKGRIDRTKLEMDLKGDLSIEIGGQTTKVTLTQNQTSDVVTTSDKPAEIK